MKIVIKNMKEFSGLFFFELVLDDSIGIRGFKITRDMDGEYELMLPQMKGKKGIYKDTSVLYDEDVYDRILEHALIELTKLTGENEVIK